jgi:hypothetical protein
MLFRLSLFSFLPLPLLFALLMGAICAQPYQPGNTRALLDMSAFGIQPGLTTLRQIRTIIPNHPWMHTTRFSRGMENGSGYLQWTWSGQQPSHIDARRQGSMWIQGGRVQWIDIATTIPYGDVWLSLPPPMDTTAFPVASRPPRAQYYAHYLEGTIRLRTEVDCPLHPAVFWTAPVIVRMQAGAQTIASAGEGKILPTWGHC